MTIKDRLQHGWNAFLGRDPTPAYPNYPIISDVFGSNTIFLSRGNERSIINSMLNKIAVDVSSITVEHARLDDESRYKEPIESRFNRCLTLATNSDQTSRDFIREATLRLLDDGVIAIVPTEATDNPAYTEGYDIGSLRIGKVVQWYPQYVKVNLYNEYTGDRVDRIFPKSMVALPENPFYAIMNQPNSIYQRLSMKLRQLDVIDNQSSSGKLDLIIQVPYTTHSDTRQRQANDRVKKIESQLSSNGLGIAYIDGTEKVIQLNRAVETNLFNQVEYYTNLLFSQMGMPMSVFDGTADEATMLNYQSRIIEPIISELVDHMKWKFLSNKARTMGQSVVFFKDPFKLTPVEKIADVADKFTRNEILSSNEVRQIIGFKPSDDPAANELRNSNLYKEGEAPVAKTPDGEANEETERKIQNG